MASFWSLLVSTKRTLSSELPPPGAGLQGGKGHPAGSLSLLPNIFNPDLSVSAHYILHILRGHERKVHVNHTEDVFTRHDLLRTDVCPVLEFKDELELTA